MGDYPAEYVPNWGSMQFLVNILRPMDPAQTGHGPENWFSTLKRAGGGCNDLVFSGHMYVAVLTAMAWQVWVSIPLILLVGLAISFQNLPSRKSMSWPVFYWLPEYLHPADNCQMKQGKS